MQVIIYGAGTFGRYAYWEYMDKTEVICFLDKNQSIWGKYHEGTNVKIESPEILAQYPEVPVVIAVENRAGIKDSLKQYGAREFIDYAPVRHMDDYVLGKQIRLNDKLMSELNQERSIILGEFLDQEIELKELSYMPGGSGLLDYAFIMTCIKKFQCKKYLEFGTYIGDSINIAAEVCDCCYSITASNKSPHAMKAWCQDKNIPDYTNRLVYKKNIVQYGCMDTKTFSLEKMIPDKDIDIYFLDGDHSYEGVMAATWNVFQHKQENAIVIWHDLKNTNYVTALAIYSMIGPERWKHVYAIDNNMCAIYLPGDMGKDLPIEAFGYTEKRKTLYVYDTILRIHQKR